MYLIIGAHGFLGSYLVRRIRKSSEEKVLAVSRRIPDVQDPDVLWVRCDIAQEKDVAALRHRTEGEHLKIIFLAAYHDPDLILQNPAEAWNINITALAMFLGYFNKFECFYYSSTEVVYGASHGKAVAEDSPRSPVSRYGQLKALAEDIVLAAGGNIVRFPVLMGPSLLSDKKHFYDHIVEALEKGIPVSMFTDQRRSMLDFETAAACLVELMEKKGARSARVVNIAGDEVLSKYDIGLMIAKKHGFPSSFILPASMDAGGVFSEKRAKETILDNALLKKLLNRETVTMVI